MTDRILRGPEVVALVGLCTSTISRMEKKGQFPKRVKLSAQAIGWLKSDIDAWFGGLSEDKKKPGR